MNAHYESREAWHAEGERRFGTDETKWRFVCPVCGYVASVSEWVDGGAPASIAFSCVGRLRKKSRKAFGGTGKGPCDYAGGGLFRLNPVAIDGLEDTFFNFAEESAE